MPNPRPQSDDLEVTSNVKRIDDLEAFRKELDGEKFYSRVIDAIQKSKDVDAEIRKVVWCTVKDKLVWIILTLLAIIFWDVLKELAVNLVSKIG